MWLEEQMLCARGGWSALNRGPQLGFHNDINGGQAEPSVVQMGKLRHIDPPIPGLYLPVQGLAYTLPLSTPSRMSCT